MAGIHRSFVVRAAGVLCLLGIGLGLGTVILYHLLRHAFRRKPRQPSVTLEENSSCSLPIGSPDGEADGVHVGRSAHHAAGLCSHESDAEHGDIDEPEISVHSTDSAGSEHRGGVLIDTSGLRLRNRKRGSVGSDVATKYDDSTELYTNWETTSVDSGSNYDSVVSDELNSDVSSADVVQTELQDSGGSNFEPSLVSPDCTVVNSPAPSSDSAYSQKEAADEPVVLRRNFHQSVIYEDFDHSTPEERVSVSFLHRGSFAGRNFIPYDFTLDSDIPVLQSRSCHDYRREFPVASRSCMSIDLGEMSSISNLVSELVDTGKLDCNVVNSMEEIQAELDKLQVEVEEIRDKVGELQSHEPTQYRLCHVDLSVDDDSEVMPSPRRRILHDMHEMSQVDFDASRRNSGFLWDHEFDIGNGTDPHESNSGVADFEGEPVGQLESFVQYRNKKVLRNVSCRGSSTFSPSIDASRFSRGDSMFDSLTPLLNEEGDQKSCSLYDVNRRLSSSFLITNLSEVSEL